MERLADRVASGQVHGGPEWAGMVYVVGSAVDSAKGNVGLIVFEPSGSSSRAELAQHPSGHTIPSFYMVMVNEPRAAGAGARMEKP